jgi:UDP-GlcNAc:undecaprenyl-phosphate/decaprenyl-phosphate GlcNAc-1-phosphate transferase
MGSLLILCFFISVLLSLAINYLFLKFSFNLGSRNSIDLKQERWSANIKPSVGGISFFLVFLAAWTIVSLVSVDKGSASNLQVIGVISASSLGFISGLYDDAFNTNPLVKFILQLLCGAILVSCGIKINISNYELLNIFFTIVWVVGLMNSINMLDNMDGVTGTVSIMIILGIIFIGLSASNGTTTFYLPILAAVLGALVGFLRFNLNPARIYMGDTGSQFLGVFLAATSIIYLWQFNDGNQGLLQIKPFVLPALFFIIPIIDTTTVTIRRLLRGESPFVGGRDHITHHLAYLGLKESKVVWVLVLTTLVSFPIAFYLLKINWGFYASFGVLAYVVLLFFAFQFLYKKGEIMHEKKLKHQPPVVKLSRKSLTEFSEELQAKN